MDSLGQNHKRDPYTFTSPIFDISSGKRSSESGLAAGPVNSTRPTPNMASDFASCERIATSSSYCSQSYASSALFRLLAAAGGFFHDRMAIEFAEGRHGRVSRTN